MPAARLPSAKAAVTGAAAKNPKRHANRTEPKSKPLGKPSEFLDTFGQQAWEGFKRELPWLMESDRALVEVASSVRGRLLAGQEVGVTSLSMLQAILSKMGASPADRTRVFVEEDDEPDEFFDS